MVLSMLVRRHCKLGDGPCAMCIQMIVCFLSIYAKSMWARCPRSAPPQHAHPPEGTHLGPYVFHEEGQVNLMITCSGAVQTMSITPADTDV